MSTPSSDPSAASPPLDPLVLLAEMGHRVANEYSLAIASISLAAHRTHHPQARTALDAAAERLRRYASAHRALQAPLGGGAMDLSAYLRELCRAQVQAWLAERNIAVTLVESPVELDAERCWRVGMIVAELVTNAARHAFDVNGGRVLVEVHMSDDEVTCRVSDDGGGWLAGAGSAAPIPGMGTRIIDALALDLGGRIERRFTAAGARVRLSFPWRGPGTSPTATAGRGPR
ncbi:sensor histidine kinase [Caulobacter sp. KR2-114]|uniref:sensor histidine kinase n=1 Tax=Caulobacter sp. KR2-114 TaxID=3400912 RepID=UPI003BFEFA32